ncbi:MAG: peptidoglycan DD-metalloendopeptidase family protein [Lachnospiraceae bacterium]|nr:peptidoglycan DD-metalloendopeptidase family protein [Lachnospiraceae bacterium]
MRKLTRYHKRIKLTYAAAAFLCCFLLLFLFNTSSFASGLDYYIVKIDGETVGTSNNRETAEQALADARIRLSKEADSIVYVDSKFTVEKEKRAFAKTEQAEELSDTIYTKLKEYTNLNYVQAIMLSSGAYSLTVDSQMTANRVLQALLNQYDTEDEYDVRLNTQKDGSFTGMTYELYDSLLMEQRIDEKMSTEGVTRSAALKELHKLESVGFVDTLEIRSVYTDSSAVFKADAAVNEALENGSALGVVTATVANYDEDYYAPVEYIYDDTMYEGQNEEEREAVAGNRNVTARIININGQESEREILSQTVYKEPVAQIVRSGTMTPPTFVQPLANCFLSSGFGYRWGSLHKGNDYACSYGEPIYASCPGTVIKAEESGDGYGNQVVIQHDDHLQTRYAHMSELACEVGQHVERYEVIGYAGSTGNSTGNHCHFEIIEDGVAIDPFVYLEGEGLDYYPGE